MYAYDQLDGLPSNCYIYPGLFCFEKPSIMILHEDNLLLLRINKRKS